ncbi:MAG: hypothetical protein HC842_05140 [Cytophagales bacterium]|nr:hypothetical protein [Cytophagales bacterium]
MNIPILNREFGPTARQSYILLLACSLLFTAHWLWCQQGPLLNDDVRYAGYAKQVLNGNFVITEDPLSSRWAPILVGAAFMGVFGVSYWALSLPMLLAGLALLLVLFLHLRRYGTGIALLSILLVGLQLSVLRFSTLFLPDLLMALFLTLALIALYEGRNNPGTAIRQALLFCAFFLPGFPVQRNLPHGLAGTGFSYHYDFVVRRAEQFWFVVFAVAFGVLMLYLCGYYWATGSVFFRLTSLMESTLVKSSLSFFDKPFWPSPFVASVMSSPFLARAGLAIPLVFGLPSLAAFELRRLHSARSYWTLLAFSYLAVFWFGSASLPYYNPLHLAEEHLITWVPLMAIAGAISLVRVLKDRRNALTFALGFAICVALTWHQQTYLMMTVYSGLVLIFSGVYFFPSLASLGIYASMIALSLPVLAQMAIPKDQGLAELESCYVSGIKAYPNRIITDSRIKENHPWFERFEPVKGQYLSFKDFVLQEEVLQAGDLVLYYAPHLYGYEAESRADFDRLLEDHVYDILCSSPQVTLLFLSK